MASRLADWRIDVKSEAKYQKSLKEGFRSLLALPGIGDATAENLYEAGFGSAEELAGAQNEELVVIPGISQQKAEKFIQAAQEYVAEQAEAESMEPTEEETGKEDNG